MLMRRSSTFGVGPSLSAISRRELRRTPVLRPRLRNALEREAVGLALSIDDRERILRALDDPPDGLAELRGVLLREHEWRLRDGLV
jgi:hypothetical protein